MELFLRISWSSLLLFTAVSSFPATNEGYRNPPGSFWNYRASRASPNLRSGALRPRVSQQFDPASAGGGQSAAVSTQFNSPPANQSPLEAAAAANMAAVRYLSPSVWGKKTPVLQSSQVSEPADDEDDGVSVTADSPPEAEQPVDGSWVVVDPSRRFPDFGVWAPSPEAAAAQSVSDTSPPRPSSYVIQSRRGFQRARELRSSLKYVKEYLMPQVIPSDPEDEAMELPPEPQAEEGQEILGKGRG
ncbi:uncharacterized protein LOC131448676 [Solea solea]|uniref:uncharacterized protein LOC131448676 n=1 Tax=Solea solea TaxID=90069 RepID=UPI00272C7371|nr:uncharacterized protein LOC131448676 [Solea solea]